MSKSSRRPTYDSVFRENFILELLDVFKVILGIEEFEVDQDTVLTSSKISRTLEREPDFVRVMRSAKGEKFILHIEFQTRDDAQMLLRMQEYHALLQRKVNLPIRHFVIYLGAKPSKMQSKMSLEHAFTGYDLKDLNDYKADQLLNSSIPEEVILVVLANNEHANPSETICKILERLTSLAGDEGKLQKYIFQLTVLSRLRNLQEETIKQTKVMPLTIEIDKDILFKEGRVKGREEGIKQIQERMVLAMIEDGDSIDKIERITGLDAGAIEVIIKQLKR